LAFYRSAKDPLPKFDLLICLPDNLPVVAVGFRCVEVSGRTFQNTPLLYISPVIKRQAVKAKFKCPVAS
jgi:hypothetical protein